MKKTIILITIPTIIGMLYFAINASHGIETYTNETFGFSVDYPVKYSIDTTLKNKSLGHGFIYFYRNEDYPSVIERKENPRPIESPLLNMFEISIHANTNGLTYEDVVNGGYGNFRTGMIYATSTVAGESALIYHWTGLNDGGGDTAIVVTDAHIVEIGSMSALEGSDLRDDLNVFLHSFRFTN